MNRDEAERYGTRFVEMLTILSSPDLDEAAVAATLTEVGYEPRCESDRALLAAASIASAMLSISTQHAQDHAVDGLTEECHLGPQQVVSAWASMRELAR